METNKISLIGLGKLGLPLLSTFAKNGQKIIGIDIDVNKINTLKNNELPFNEPNLKEYLISGKENIEYSDTFRNIVNNVDIAIILVNTPSDNKGEFSNKYIFNALDGICENLKNTEKKDFLFIISSTVMPGSHNQIIQTIENAQKEIKNLNHFVTKDLQDSNFFFVEFLILKNAFYLKKNLSTI